MSYFQQGCEWNERSLNRGLNRGRGLGSDTTFFWALCSNLEIDENFRISHNLGLGLAAKISQAFAIQLGRYQDQNTHPAPTAHPPKNPYLVCWCNLSRTCVDHMVRGWGHRYPPPPHTLRRSEDWQDLSQCCQMAEIPAKKLKRGRRKKKLWPNFGWFYQKVAEKGPQKIFKRSSLFLAVITTYNVHQDKIKFDFL